MGDLGIIILPIRMLMQGSRVPIAILASQQDRNFATEFCILGKKRTAILAKLPEAFRRNIS